VKGEPGEVLLSTPPAAKAVTSPKPVERFLPTDGTKAKGGRRGRRV